MSDLKVKRGRFKGQLSRFISYIESLQDREITDQIYHEIQCRVEKCENLLDKFCEVQDEVELTLDESEITELRERDDFETKFYKYMGLARSIVSNFAEKKSDSLSIVSRDSVPDISTQVTKRNLNQAKFPAIRIPTFKGEYNKYLEFRDGFSALVHNNSNLSNTEKFYYLKSSLEDRALDVIQSLEVTEANYIIAWQLIKERFENKKLIILNHVKAIFEFPKLEKECHSSLRSLYDNMQKNLRALKSLNQPTDYWDTLIIYITSSKLDLVTRKDWESYKIQGDIPDLTDFNLFLKDKCEVLEKLEYNLRDQSSKGPNFSKNRIRQVFTSFKFECYFCSGNHSVYKCDRLLNLPIHARIKEIKKKCLCLNCLRPGHINNECTFSRCRTCNQLHNTLVHINSQSQRFSNHKGEDSNKLNQATFSQASNDGFGQIQNQSYGNSSSISSPSQGKIQGSSQGNNSSLSSPSQGKRQGFNQGNNSSLVYKPRQARESSQVYKPSQAHQSSQVYNSSLAYEPSQAHESSQVLDISEQVDNLGFENQSYTMTSTSNGDCQVLLATAIVLVRDNKGCFHKARALLDNGSQSNFITHRLCSKLGLQQENIKFTIKGIGQALSNISHQVKVQLKSCNSGFDTEMSCLILSSITDIIPSSSFNCNDLEIPPNIKLADPSFNKADKIDILIGSSIFWNLLSIGQIQLGTDKPTLQKTLLGWIVSGTINIVNGQNNSHYKQDKKRESKCFLIQSDQQVDDQLSKFWQLEECQISKPLLTDSENYCESHFKNNVQRNMEGRFIVRMPLKESCQLGDSKEMALKRYLSLEQKLNKNNDLKLHYVEFMREYEKLGHMSRVLNQGSEQSDQILYYMPHHAIIRDCSLTTKTRVVFDASAKSSNGFSLNDVQFSGPTVQSDLFSILLRFRQFPFVLSADITKMYRQVLIADDQKCLQRIFWRENPSDDIQVFQLNTVTYGTASAPFLAIRCLMELANDNESSYPSASKVIKEDFYCDDLLTSCSSIEDLLGLQRDISKILSSAGFSLRKWLTNKPELISEFIVSNELEYSVLQLGPDESNKTLGVLWNSNLDTLQYAISPNSQDKVTKRVILSVTSQIFDPLGLLGPVVIKSKVILQKLWQAGLSWDEAVPQSIYSDWLKFQQDLETLNQLKIPRYALSENAQFIELHGFADSSELAYGACIYIRCTNEFGFQSSHLICAKSRVAPLKQVSLPRLELCAANLLAVLASKVLKSVNLSISKRYYWSDSTITLGWIKSPARGWKTFVANRVGDIQTITDPSEWHHVKSCENPADLLSRGVKSSDLLNSELWWHGPKWLTLDKSSWKLSTGLQSADSLPERRSSLESTSRYTDPESVSMCLSSITIESKLFDKFSSFIKLQRVVAFCMRFIKNARSIREHRQTSCLTTKELEDALNILVKISQIQSFPAEYNNLIQGKPISKNSRLSTLNAFMEHDLIRVGGRLSNSEYDFDKKHPLVLSALHRLTYLILVFEHERLLHCGPQHLLASVRERFWPIAGRSLARKITRSCITCFKVKPTCESYKMGDLPQVRVTSSHAFLNVGIDFAGPILLKDRKLRNTKMIKAYIAVFICMSTKAIHLDLVTDLTTNAFLAMLKRFICRRGKPSNIYTDNGTTFVGANSQLKEFYSFLQTSNTQVSNSLSKDGIEWHFIPPRSPNFGGLWEAGVKSTKYHLKRVVGNLHLTYESMMTVLIQIEGILNSRPLTPFSSDPSDFNPLTPAHFLIGKSIMSIPESNLTVVKTNRLDMFHQQQQAVQMFWNRWHREYISELQSRLKWKENAVSMLKIGSLVIIKDENQPTLKWQLGRVTNIYPGRDNVVRVASVQLPSGGEIKRVLSKLCVLPLEE